MIGHHKSYCSLFILIEPKKIIFASILRSSKIRMPQTNKVVAELLH